MDGDPLNAVDRSELEALRSDMGQGFARLEGKLDAYQAAHQATHVGEQAAFNAHLREAAVRQTEVSHLGGLTARVDSLEDWRTQVQALGTLVRLLFGTSVLGALASIVSLLYAVSK